MGSENSAKKGSVHVNENEDTDRVYYITGGFRQSRPILKGKDAKKTFDSIPTIDVANVFSPDLGLRKAVAKEVAKAAEEVGFFYAANPPVSTQKIDAAFEVIKAFFDLPENEKLKLHVDNSQGVKGYHPIYHEDGTHVRSSYGMGNDYTNTEQHFVKVAPLGCIPVNQWPDDILPEFRKVIYEYYREVYAFGKKLLQIFALSLGLEETDLDEIFHQPLTDITMQYYPVQAPSKDKRASLYAHADYGDKVAGLEVLNANGIWVPAPPKDHTYIVNTGSYMEVLSNSRYPATVHRAFGNENCERFSLPFFFNPDPTAIITPHPQLITPGEPARFEPQHVGRRTVKGVMFNRPNHPFLKKLKALGLEEDELTYDLLSQPIKKCAAAKLC